MRRGILVILETKAGELGEGSVWDSDRCDEVEAWDVEGALLVDGVDIEEDWDLRFTIMQYKSGTIDKRHN